MNRHLIAFALFIMAVFSITIQSIFHFSMLWQNVACGLFGIPLGFFLSSIRDLFDD
jgi:hypothetical protein